MTDTDELTTWLAATLDAIEAAVLVYRDGHPGPCLNYEGQHPDAYDEYDSCYLHIRDAEASPYRDAEFGLAEVDTKRRILDVVDGWQHHACQDGWYSCSQATESNGYDPDVACADEDRAGEPCDCGLDVRRRAIAAPMALPLAAHPGYRDEWHP